MEAKRTAEEMEDSITVAARDAMRKRQAREVSYPQAGRRSETLVDKEMIVEVSPEPAGTAQNSPEPHDDENDSESEEEQPLPKKTRKARKTGVQQWRKVPIKLRAKAQPERMVDKILDQPIDRITVRELLGFVARSAARDLGDSEVATIEQNDDPEHSGSGYWFRRHCGDD